MYMEPQKTPNYQNNLKKIKNKSGGITLGDDIRLNCKVIVIKQHGTGTKADTSVNGVE